MLRDMKSGVCGLVSKVGGWPDWEDAAYVATLLASLVDGPS